MEESQISRVWLSLKKEVIFLYTTYRTPVSTTRAVRPRVEVTTSASDWRVFPHSQSCKGGVSGGQRGVRDRCHPRPVHGWATVKVWMSQGQPAKVTLYYVTSNCAHSRTAMRHTFWLHLLYTPIYIFPATCAVLRTIKSSHLTRFIIINRSLVGIF